MILQVIIFKIRLLLYMLSWLQCIWLRSLEEEQLPVLVHIINILSNYCCLPSHAYANLCHQQYSLISLKKTKSYLLGNFFSLTSRTYLCEGAVENGMKVLLYENHSVVTDLLQMHGTACLASALIIKSVFLSGNQMLRQAERFSHVISPPWLAQLFHELSWQTFA